MPQPFWKSSRWFLVQPFHPLGRLSRLEFLNTQIYNFLLSIMLLSWLDSLGWSQQAPGMLLFLGFGTSLLLMSYIKRYQDMGLPLERLVYCLLPVICLYFWAEPFFRRGQAETNAAGPSPAQLRYHRSWLITQLCLPFLLSLCLFGFVRSP